MRDSVYRPALDGSFITASCGISAILYWRWQLRKISTEEHVCGKPHHAAGFHIARAPSYKYIWSRESHVWWSDRRWSFLYILFRFSTFPITKVFPVQAHCANLQPSSRPFHNASASKKKTIYHGATEARSFTNPNSGQSTEFPSLWKQQAASPRNRTVSMATCTGQSAFLWSRQVETVCLLPRVRVLFRWKRETRHSDWLKKPSLKYLRVPSFN